jgi:hypothetical protein
MNTTKQDLDLIKAIFIPVKEHYAQKYEPEIEDNHDTKN